MNSANIYAIKMSIIVFPIVAAIILLPYLIFQYRKYGSVVLFKAIVTYAFIYYLITALFLVMLPLYSRTFVSNMKTPYYDLEVFGFMRRLSERNLLNISTKSDIFRLVSNSIFLEAFFNVMLTVPLGVFLRYYFKRQWWEVILLSFSLSLFFELSQLSGLYGFYSRPHRLFQIDDLILNTTGGLIGYLITPILVFMFPSRDRLDEISENRSTRVGPLRRLSALVIDGTIIMIFGVSLFKYLYPTVSLKSLAFNFLKYVKLLMFNDLVYWSVVFFLLIFFIVIPLMLNGSTIGKKIVKIKLTNNEDSELSFLRLVSNNLITFLILNFYYFSLMILLKKTGENSLLNLGAEYVLITLVGLTFILLVAAIYNALISKRTLSEVLSKTRHTTY